MSVTAASGKALQFDIIVSDGFVLTEMAGVVDTLRIANRLAMAPMFRWRFLSAAGGSVSSPAGAVVETDPFGSRSDAQVAIVLGNADPTASGLSVGRLIDGYTSRNITVVLMAEAASRFIKERGCGTDHATHWENLAVMEEQLGVEAGAQVLASQIDGIVTCAGMGAAVDLTLALIAPSVSRPMLMTIADVLLHEKIRDFGTLQPFGGKQLALTGDGELDMCVELMQANMEEPLAITEIVNLVGISSRSLERKFRKYLGMTPNSYYRALRLHKANNLLLNTAMSVREIGLACGFPGGFGAAYRDYFGVAPITARRQRQNSQT